MMGRISWVIAFRPEAQPVIDRFSLRKVKNERELFPVYRSEDGRISLVLSGLGKVLSSAAAVYLASTEPEDSSEESLWLNFGIAGSGERDFGKAFLGSRITDEGSGKSWYPPAVWSRGTGPARREVRTVDRPVLSGIEGSSLVDMEASGFMAAASKLNTLEFCQCIKVVSDDPDHSVHEIDRSRVEALCEKALDESLPFLEELTSLCGERAARRRAPVGFQEWTERVRFTVSQGHQLRKLLQKFEILGESQRSLDLLSERRSEPAKACLQSLREELELVRMRNREK